MSFFWHIAKHCLTTLSPDNYIETLSTNQKNEMIVMGASNNQSPANQFFSIKMIRWTLKWDLDPQKMFSKCD